MRFMAAMAMAATAGAAGAGSYEARDPDYLCALRAGAATHVAVADGVGPAAKGVLPGAGLAGLLFPGSAQARAAGAATGGDVRPARFEAEGVFGRTRQRVAMRYGGDEGLALEADPPLRARSYDVQLAAMADALDPLSAAVAALVPQPAAGACDRVIAVFDTRRRFDLRLGPAVQTEDGLRCEGVFRRVAGYKARHMRQPDHPFTVWWRASGGLATLERATAPTPFGHAVARRL